MARKKEQIEILNDDKRQVSSNHETKPINALTNGSSSKAIVDYSKIIQTYQTLSNRKKDEYIKLYIDMSWQNPLYVTLDQHAHAFDQIGIPINACQQKEELNADDKGAESVTKDVDKAMNLPNPAMEQPTREKVVCLDNSNINGEQKDLQAPPEKVEEVFNGEHKNDPQAPSEKVEEVPEFKAPKILNSRLARRRVTIYYK